MSTNYKQPGDVISWTNGTGSAVVSGQLIAIGALVAVALVDIANGDMGSVGIAGQHAVTKIAGTAWVQGDKLDLDLSAASIGKGITPAAGDVTDGCVAGFAAASGDVLGEVILTPGTGTAN